MTPSLRTLLAALAVPVLFALPALAEDAAPAGTPATPAASPAPAAADTLKLNFPDNTEISVLVKFVSERLHLNILYDEAIGGKKLTLRTPDPIPASSLRSLLESSLAMKGLALVPVPGKANWYRIVPAQQLPQAATENGAVLARVFRLKTAEAEAVANLVRPLLTQGGGQAMAIPNQPVLLVTDYADRVEQASKLIDLADSPAGQTVEFHKVAHVAASRLLDEANRLLGSNTKAAQIMFLEGRGVLAISGRPEQVAAVKALLEKLDIAGDQETKVFTFGQAAPENVLRAFRDLLPDADKASFQATVDGPSLIVRATPAKLAEFEAFKTQLDSPRAASSTGRMQFYKLVNADVDEVRKTLEEFGRTTGLAALAAKAGENGTLAPIGAAGAGAKGATAGGNADAFEAMGAKIVTDKGTNTLIIVADPQVQALFRQLIAYLDTRRPQVLLECTIVTIDFSKDKQLAVDVSGIGQTTRDGHTTNFLNFTQFGVSTADPKTGNITPIGLSGFNGAILSGDVANIVIHALQTDSRATVSSCPRILVNDNAEGELKSTNKVPYLSTNASSTVATTSVGGSEEAGTNIKVKPSISSDDHLRLKFTAELSSFTGAATATLPPPSQQNTLTSDVTIPDGSTIIVGGVTRGDTSHTRSQVPILGDIPILGFFFRGTEDKESKTVLFVFIKPTIMRDDEFKDLKFYSDVAVTEAKIPQDMPAPEPQVLHTR